MIRADPKCPPNGQGLTALVALGIVEAVEEQHGIDILKVEHNSTQYLHILIEAMRLAFADSRSQRGLQLQLMKARYYVTDPTFERVPVEEMLSKVRYRHWIWQLMTAIPGFTRCAD